MDGKIHCFVFVAMGPGAWTGAGDAVAGGVGRTEGGSLVNA